MANLGTRCGREWFAILSCILDDFIVFMFGGGSTRLADDAVLTIFTLCLVMRCWHILIVIAFTNHNLENAFFQAALQS